MQKVYFKAIDSYSKTDEINSATLDLLKEVVRVEEVKLESFIPLKAHFGEKGNKSFIQSHNFESIIEYFKENQIESEYIETNVLYRGERTTEKSHIALAKQHGFTQLPIHIADGELGGDYELIEINKKHFKSCMIAKGMAKQKQMIILSHFKGHVLAGFGGAIKQLAMGCASRGGKLAQHANSIPDISFMKCKGCKACGSRCPENAILINKKAKIEKEKCVGCAACMAVCPYGAITNSWLASLTKSFYERLAEYAYAAAIGKNNIYITYALNITKNCDCEGHSMKPIAEDLGIFASTDPVAIDQACLDLLDKREGKTFFKKGREALEYGESIGLGSRSYQLIEI